MPRRRRQSSAEPSTLASSRGSNAFSLAVLLCVASCANTPPEACTTESIGSLPTVPAYNFLVVPVTLGDKPATMMIDTSSEDSVIADGQQTRLGLAPDPHGFTEVYGVGGTHIHVQNVIVPSIRFGDRASGELGLPVGELPQLLETLDPPVAGILGLDVLRPFDLDIDRPAHRVDFYLRSGCDSDTDAPPWKAPAERIDLFTSTLGLLIAPVTIDGVRLDAVVDTGARRSVISDAALARLGLDDAALAADPVMQSEGIDQKIGRGHLHRFATFAVGHTVFHNAQLVAGGARLPIGEMLLGEDFLSGHRLWFSPSAAAAFIVKQRPVIPASGRAPVPQ